MSQRRHPSFSVILAKEERGPVDPWKHGGKAYRKAFIKPLY